MCECNDFILTFVLKPEVECTAHPPQHPIPISSRALCYYPRVLQECKQEEHLCREDFKGEQMCASKGGLSQGLRICRRITGRVLGSGS